MFHPFLWPNNVSRCVAVPFCVSIHQLMGVCIVYTFWFLMLLLTFVFKVLFDFGFCRHDFRFLG